MPAQATSMVCLFGALHGIRKDRGLSSVVEMDIPTEGCVATEIIDRLDLPVEKVEAVFINNKLHSLNHHIYPGDRVAFVPTGVPGSRGLFCVKKDT